MNSGDIRLALLLHPEWCLQAKDGLDPSLVRPIGKVQVLPSVLLVSSRSQNHFHGVIMFALSPTIWIQSYEKCHGVDYSSHAHSKKCIWNLVLEKTEKAAAPHSSALAWKIPWAGEPGRLQSMGSRRVRHDWATSLSLSTFMHWRRKWQPAPVFLLGESQGQGSLVGCRLWGRRESDTTKAT